MRRALLLTVVVGWAALIATVGAGCEDAEPAGEPRAEPPAVEVRVPLAETPAAASSPQSVEPRPQAVRFAPGERVDAARGAYYLDVTTGAVTGWQLPAAPEIPLPPYPTSASGRYITYPSGRDIVVVGSPLPHTFVSADRLFDTHTGSVRALTPGVHRRFFAPNDARYLEGTAHGVDLLRTADGVRERRIVLDHLGYAPDRLVETAWSPSAEIVLVWWSVENTGGPPMTRIVRIDVPSGRVVELLDGVHAQGGWSPDGSLFYIAAHGVLEARETASGLTRWRLTAEDLGLAMPLKDGIEPLGGWSIPLTAPGGRNAVVLAAGAGPTGRESVYRVALIDPESGTVRFWVENALSCGRRWTADGRWLHVVGERGGESGSFLVSEDGAEIRFLGRFVMDLSPLDARVGVYRPFAPGEPSIAALDLETGDSRPLAVIDGDWGWDTNHDPLWLADGRTVVHAPHPGHGGCGFHESPGDLAIHVPAARPTPPPAAPGDTRRSAGALLTANRDRLAVCVQGVGSAASDGAAAREWVARALALVAQHPQFAPAGLGGRLPVVEEGCPHGPYLLEPGVFWENGIPIAGSGRRVQEASHYRLFVFLLPPAELARVIHGSLDIRRAAEEMLCQGHNCGEVTTGIYLTPEETRDEPFLIAWLTKGLGLEPTLPPGNAPVPPGR